MEGMFSLTDDNFMHSFTVRKDVMRLLGQLLLSPMLAIAFLLGFDDRRTRLKESFAGIMLCCYGCGDRVYRLRIQILLICLRDTTTH